MEKLELYTYCKSSAAYRVRIALNLKQLTYTPHYVSLIKDGGENYRPAYTAVNPQAMVPSLKTSEGVITQSTAIIEWLEEIFPAPPLLPDNALDRATARSYAQMIACDIHPLNNLRVLDYLKTRFNRDDADTNQWYHNWIHEGFTALEKRISSSGKHGKFCIGDTPSIADVFLVPQIYNANRYHCKMSNFPTLRAINENCLSLESFRLASPELQEDFIDQQENQ